jgi:2-oxoisovalerate dehydrogenase E2 component (dihydrolipoyl transacylase)
MSVFHLPDLGEGLTEAEIVTWHVTEGQHVVKDQPLVSVETDKAVVEIPAPQAGRVVKLHGKVGDHLPVGAPLASFDEALADAGAIVGDVGPAPDAATREVARTVKKPRAAPAAPPAHVKAAPAVRALAQARGVDLSRLVGTGAAGQITREDVERAASATATPRAAPEGFEPLRGPRRAMARNMARAGAAVVPAGVSDDADVSSWAADSDVTARLIRALIVGCRAEPALNATFDGEALARRLNDAVHIGIATDTADGLIVPVLRDAQARDAAELRRVIDTLKSAARERRTTPEELRGATITLSNFGALGGGRYAMLVILPPQVAILGAGRAEAQLVPVDGKPAIRRRLPLSLTFDHRAVSGGEAARFLAAVIADLEKPA